MTTRTQAPAVVYRTNISTRVREAVPLQEAALYLATHFRRPMGEARGYAKRLAAGEEFVAGGNVYKRS